MPPVFSTGVRLRARLRQAEHHPVSLIDYRIYPRKWPFAPAPTPHRSFWPLPTVPRVRHFRTTRIDCLLASCMMNRLLPPDSACYLLLALDESCRTRHLFTHCFSQVLSTPPASMLLRTSTCSTSILLRPWTHSAPVFSVACANVGQSVGSTRMDFAACGDSLCPRSFHTPSLLSMFPRMPHSSHSSFLMSFFLSYVITVAHSPRQHAFPPPCARHAHLACTVPAAAFLVRLALALALRLAALSSAFALPCN